MVVGERKNESKTVAVFLMDFSMFTVPGDVFITTLSDSQAFIFLAIIIIRGEFFTLYLPNL